MISKKRLIPEEIGIFLRSFFVYRNPIPDQILLMYIKNKECALEPSPRVNGLQSSNFLTASCDLSPCGQPYFVGPDIANWAQFGPF